MPSSTCTNRLLLAALDWKPEDSGTTQKEDVKKTPGKMLSSILSKRCSVCYTHFCFVNDHGKFSESQLKINKLNIVASVKLPVRFLAIKYFVYTWFI